MAVDLIHGFCSQCRASVLGVGLYAIAGRRTIIDIARQSNFGVVGVRREARLGGCSPDATPAYPT